GCRLCIEDVAGRRFEELERSCVLERWGVRHVDNDCRALEGLGETLTGEGVDAGVQGRGHGFVTVVAQVLDELGPDQPGPADDDDLHDDLSFVSGRDESLQAGGVQNAPGQAPRSAPYRHAGPRDVLARNAGSSARSSARQWCPTCPSLTVAKPT